MSSASPLLRRAIAALAAIAVLTAFCLAIIVAYSRNASRRAASEMHVVFRAQAPLLDQAEKREQQRHIVLRKDLAGISKAERAAKTPAEIAKRLPTAFPPLPRPVWASLAPRASDAPEAPAIITVPQEDLKPLFDRLEDCRTCQEQQTRQASGVRSPQFWRPDKTRQASGVSISPTVILRGLCWMTLSSC